VSDWAGLDVPQREQGSRETADSDAVEGRLVIRVEEREVTSLVVDADHV